MHFKDPNILHTSDELSWSNFFLGSITMFPVGYDRTNFFILGVMGMIDPRNKIDRESSSEVLKMLGFKMQIQELDFYTLAPL